MVAPRIIKIMKNPFSKFWLIVAFISFVTLAGANDRWEILRAINWVENPDNHTRVGRFGELGPYQFRPATWKMHSTKPFSLAMQRAEADAVAVKHYEWLKKSFEQAGVEVNAFNIALAWNCGLTTVLRGRAPEVSYDYASRVTNLVEMLKGEDGRQKDQKQLSVERTAEPMAEEQKSQKPETTDGDVIRFRVLLNTPSFVIASL